jgi:hypothetical protein
MCLWLCNFHIITTIIFCWCFCVLALHHMVVGNAGEPRPNAAGGKRTENTRPALCCSSSAQVSPSCLTCLRLWAMCARSWRSCAGKLGNSKRTETWQKLGESRFWNFLNIYPNYLSSFWRWFFHFQIFQCFFLSLLARITVWASWCWFFLRCIPGSSPVAFPQFTSKLSQHTSIDIEQYRQYTIT